MATTPKPHRSKASRATTLQPHAHMGDRLDALLRQRNISHAEFARRLQARGVLMSRQNMSLKMAMPQWRSQDLWAIATTAGVPTDYFFFEQFTLPRGCQA